MLGLKILSSVTNNMLKFLKT